MILSHTNWTTPASFIAKDIFEYDMKRGGLSIIKQKKLLPEELIQKLDSMPKEQAHREEGNLKRVYKDLSKQQMDAFTEYRLLFGEMNELTDDDIVSVAKDAIFTTKYCGQQKLAEYIEFREKNYYTSFLQINKICIYKGDHTDVKGIHDDKIEYHEKGMLLVLARLMDYLSRYDKEGYLHYLVSIMNEYKKRKLPIEYYRSFDSKSKYQYRDDVMEAQLDFVASKDMDHIDISYNYKNILVPMLQLTSR